MAAKQKILPERRLAIASRTFSLKNTVHKKVKFGHFVQRVCGANRSVDCNVLMLQITQLRRILSKKEKFGGKF